MVVLSQIAIVLVFILEWFATIEYNCQRVIPIKDVPGKAFRAWLVKIIIYTFILIILFNNIYQLF